MRTDFSEFSYGYALTEEFAASLRHGLHAAPIFPSLIEEGKPGGGYDVKFDLPAVPLFIQFKRPDVMMTGRAKEKSKHALPINVPFYRMHIRSSWHSKQHELLLSHDTAKNRVYYASPCFHELDDLNRFYLAREVIDHTLFVRPRDIGHLNSNPHYLAYDYTCACWRFSDPVRLETVTRGRAIGTELVELLRQEKRRMSEGPLDDAIRSVEKTLRESQIEIRDMPSVVTGELGEFRSKLQRLASLAMTYLNAQLFFVQPEN